MSTWINILIWIGLGAVVGLVVSFLTKNRLSLILYMLVGIVGSVLGGWIASMLGIGGGLIGNLLIAFGSACLLLLVVWLVRGQEL